MSDDDIDEAVNEIARLRDEIASLRLTDDERAAVAWAAKQMQYIRADNAAATLRSLLERTGGGR